MKECDVCALVCVYLYMQWPHQLFSPLLQAAQTLKQFVDKETFTYSKRLMLEVDFETLIDNAESGVDKYIAFKDTMSG